MVQEDMAEYGLEQWFRVPWGTLGYSLLTGSWFPLALDCK